MSRYAARVDANQATICAALRQIGAKICLIGTPLDLLVGFRGRNVLIEVKIPSEGPSKSQQAFLDTWPGEAHVVHNVDEALSAIIGKKHLQ